MRNAELSDPTGVHPDPRSGADSSAATDIERGTELEIAEPAHRETERDALERLWEAQERIAALEEMLTKARERERELTTEAVRHRARIFEAEARIFELSSIAARVTASEDAQHEAESVAQESERAAALAESKAKSAEIEIGLLRSRNAELENDLTSIADELAAETVARTEAVRLEREQNEARERAQVEQRLAAEGRLRATEATLRASRSEDREPDEDAGIASMNEDGRGWAAADPVEGDAGEAEERGGIPDPGIDAGDASVVPVGEASAAVKVDETPADEGQESPTPASVTEEPPERPAWSTSTPAASAPTTADPWSGSEATMWGRATPLEADRDVSTEPDVVDLVSEEKAAEATSDTPPFEERVGIDSSARPTSGWSENWGLLRGRRKH